MDFFEHQAAARRRTTLLVFYFVVAVVLIVAALNVAAAALTAYIEPARAHFYDTPPLLIWDAEVAAWTTGLTLLVILGGTLYRWLTLRSGGRAVAELAGGRELAPGTATPAEQRLLNIVEEMSIASGVPMPAVYLRDDEGGLNAFAAGLTTSDAVVAVTRGSLEKLSRDELQGVVAHEFSHILNGDMRLNVRLTAVLFGILVIGLMGRGILRSLRYAPAPAVPPQRQGSVASPVFIIAVIVHLIVGYIGYSSAASSRPPSPASASPRRCRRRQFTRNPPASAAPPQDRRLRHRLRHRRR
jgi:Zn-dependent protease with chaperone function